ncbi:MAG: hypothetical protein QXQ60_05375 [Thermofilum sp.]
MGALLVGLERCRAPGVASGALEACGFVVVSRGREGVDAGIA